MAFLTPADLAPFATIDPAKAEVMIADAEAMAAMAAPCILDPELSARPELVAAVKAILRGAVLRWNEAGTGAKSTTQETAGPFSVSATMDTTQPRRGMFWPSELTQLQDICATFNGETPGKAWSVDTAPGGGGRVHSPLCSLGAGALYCSCGSDINRYEGPLYEGGLLS